MAQLVVRTLEDTVKARLHRRAQRHGRSMEEEAREILRNAVSDDMAPSLGLGTEIAALFKNAGLKSPIRELRGQAIKPVSFRS